VKWVRLCARSKSGIARCEPGHRLAAALLKPGRKRRSHNAAITLHHQRIAFNHTTRNILVQKFGSMGLAACGRGTPQAGHRVKEAIFDELKKTLTWSVAGDDRESSCCRCWTDMNSFCNRWPGKAESAALRSSGQDCAVTTRDNNLDFGSAPLESAVCAFARNRCRGGSRYLAKGQFPEEPAGRAGDKKRLTRKGTFQTWWVAAAL